MGNQLNKILKVGKSLSLIIAIVVSVSAFGKQISCRDFIANRLASLSHSLKKSDAIYSALREKIAGKLEGVLYIHKSGIEFYGYFQRLGTELEFTGVSLEVKNGHWSQRQTAVFAAAFWRVLKDEIDSDEVTSVTITATEIRNPLFFKMLHAYGFEQTGAGDTLILKLNAG